MSLGYVKVGCIMPGCNCHYTGTKFHINCLIFYYRCCYLSIYPLYFYLVTMLVLLVTFIFRVHYYIFIAEFCFWPSSSNSERAVLKIVERLFNLFPFDFVIRNGSFKSWVPVNNARAAVNS